MTTAKSGVTTTSLKNVVGPKYGLPLVLIEYLVRSDKTVCEGDHCAAGYGVNRRAATKAVVAFPWQRVALQPHH